MDSDGFSAKVDSGEIAIDSHERLLRIAFIYLEKRGFEGDGAFDIANTLHDRKWTFGQGNLRFNRSLDLFYVSQLYGCMYSSSHNLEDYLTGDLDAFYAEYYDTLNPEAWRQWYSVGLITQPISARFYRLPDLQDLHNAAFPLCGFRDKGVGHFTKLPRWANTVKYAFRRTSLPPQTIADLAISLLKESIVKLQADYPDIQPYSETQAYYWLRGYGLPVLPEYPHTYVGSYGECPWDYNQSIGRGHADPWSWVNLYSPELWNSPEARDRFVEPDLDGKRRTSVMGVGWPDGGCGHESRLRAWDPELGSEEEIEFLAAVASAETDGVTSPDLSIHSHLLLSVMLGVSDPTHLDHLCAHLLKSGCFPDEAAAARWVEEALAVMRPYVEKPVVDGVERKELFHRILVENGQLFGLWMVYQEFDLGIIIKKRF